jgi:hypothetical protein
MSQRHFTPQLQRTGTTPLVMTTNFMAPEAYLLNALANAWLQGKSAAETREAVAQVYAKYQKISQKAARGLFTVGGN